MTSWTQRSLFAVALAAGAYACSSSQPPNSPGTGGTTDTGGAPATGGVMATGGAPATGGVKATGGAGAGGSAATGGMKATGGSTGTGGERTAKGICETTGYSGWDFKGISFQFDPWNNGNSGQMCADVSPTSFTINSFALSPKDANAPAAYPSFYLGVHAPDTAVSVNTALPKAYSGITSVPTSVQIAPSGGKWDASYDIWLNGYAGKSGSTEVMVWLNWSGVQPIGNMAQGATTIDGVQYSDIWKGSGGGWTVISFRMKNVNSASFDIKKVIDYAVTQKWTTATELTAVEMGYEGWSGIAGAAVNNFSISVK